MGRSSALPTRAMRAIDPGVTPLKSNAPLDLRSLIKLMASKVFMTYFLSNNSYDINPNLSNAECFAYLVVFLFLVDSHR